MKILEKCMHWALLALVLWLGSGESARADSCVAVMTDVVFAQVSPIAGSDYFASGTLTIKCVMSPRLPTVLFPNLSYCASLGAGSGGASGAWRTMAAGGSRLPYNLYLDSSYGGAAVWGGAAMPANQTPLLVSVPAGVVAMGSFSRTHTIYGKVPGSMLAGVATAGNADTVFASIFGADATFTYAFSSVSGTPSCTAGTTSTLPFQVRATVINDAFINASNLQFGSSSVLTGTVRANAALALQLTANNAYRIALDGGMHGSVGERRMRNALTGETVRYVISGTPDGPGWGDGTAGTSTVAGTGTGTVQSLPLYGRVPPQPTPSPGDYKDTLTVTVYF